MKNIFSKIALLASLIPVMNSLCLGSSINNQFIQEESYSSNNLDPEYPLLSSKNITNLINQTWGNIDDNRNTNIGQQILNSLLKVADEIRNVDPNSVLGALPTSLADSITSSVNCIQNHAFSNSDLEIKCIRDYSDKIIRYLKDNEYTIIG